MYRVGFTKMQGAGNDYIYVNTSVFPIRNPEKLAIKYQKNSVSIKVRRNAQPLPSCRFRHAALDIVSSAQPPNSVLMY